MDASNISFDPANMYGKRPAEKTRIIGLILANAPAGAGRASVVNGWHTSKSDRRQHCTVDFYDANGSLISRKHVV
ncbi:hypothetical protein PG994_005005 [Apiospora phragmitis]|uniref:Uncharacterized protein n=1 Tax=Apiospora phragmitis TaxID=2905665 RepID=A0ABR1VUV8_9PEZI